MVKLKSLIEQIESTPVSIGFLKKRVPANVAVYAYQQLKGKSRSELFKKNKALIVLIPKKNEKKGHYIALLARHNHIEYFSSLGQSPDSEMDKLHQSHTSIKNILGKNYIYNHVKLQRDRNYNINTCGAFVLARVFFHDLKLREFTELFRRISLQNPDEIASIMVLLHFVSL